MICMYSDVMLYLPSRDLLCHMNLICRHTARLIFLQTNICLLLTHIGGNINSWLYKTIRHCWGGLYHICTCLRHLDWNWKYCRQDIRKKGWITWGDLKQYKANCIIPVPVSNFSQFTYTPDVRIWSVEWRLCYWWVSWLPLDTPNRCQDIYFQQATTASSHIHSKS